ncbi:MAG: hypothetical protein M3209_08440 [Acidobacteriota bacterium]|nr:hypothetical protein [Acidobacteriota bacterium]
MSEYNESTELSDNRALVRSAPPDGEDTATSTPTASQDWRGQAQVYGQQATEVLNKAKGYAQEYFGQAGDKIKNLQDKDLNQITEDAKDFARRKPGQALLISAAAGLVIGFLLKGRR